MAQFASRDGRLSPAHDMQQNTLGFVQTTSASSHGPSVSLVTHARPRRLPGRGAPCCIWDLHPTCPHWLGGRCRCMPHHLHALGCMPMRLTSCLHAAAGLHRGLGRARRFSSVSDADADQSS